jgi:hypothetical protein
MWSRGLSRRPVLLRAGVVALAVLGSSAVGLSAASAADQSTIVLDDPIVETYIRSVENGQAGVVSVPYAPPGSGQHEIAAGYGGTVTITAPPHLVDDGGVSAELTVEGPTEPVYSSTSSDPDTALPLVALGGNVYRVTLPTDDTVNGPSAALTLTGFAVRNDPGVIVSPGASMPLTLSDAGPAAVDVTLQFNARATDCAKTGFRDCRSVAVVAPGDLLTVTLPADSAYRALGIPDLGDAAFGLQLPSLDGRPTPVVSGAVTRGADASTVTLAVPADVAPGVYVFSAVMGDGTGQVWASYTAHVEVAQTEAPSAGAAPSTPAAPTTPAPAGLNPGLRSETGGDAGSPALLPVVLGSVGALAVAGVAVRSRRPAARS